MGSVLLIFIDGLGIGPPDPKTNPLASLFNPGVLNVAQAHLGPVVREGRIFPTDATLGVAGLPQSATGQTTLFTGINAAHRLGRHLSGFPTHSLRKLIRSYSLFRQLKDSGQRVTFANAYTDRFFEDRPRWVSVTTVMCESAGVELRRLEDLEKGRALFMDFSNRRLSEAGLELPVRSAEEAGQLLASLASEYNLCLYEYFLTDLVGHRGTLNDAIELLQNLDRFLTAVVEHVDLEETAVLITSDHGNIECMDRRLHTRNPVPTLVWGPLQACLPEGEVRLEDISPSIVRFLESSR